MFCPSDARDYRRALYGSFFDESLIIRQSKAPAPKKRLRPQLITLAAPEWNRDRARVESQVG